MQSFAPFRNISSNGIINIKMPKRKEMDIEQLVERCKNGESQAINLLYSTYSGKMEQVCRKYVKDESYVKDIVHDSFVVILTSLDRLKNPQKLESWMCTIVRNLSLKHLQRPVLERMERVEMADEEQREFPDYEKLMEMVEQLPEGYKNVLKLSVLEGLSHKEIGEMLDIAPHTSSSQLARAKELMRRNLRRCGAVLMSFLSIVLPFLFDDDDEPSK